MAKNKATVSLGLYREDPDNVSEATDEEFGRLAGKIDRVPLGLTAMRIAYVTDAPGGGRMVISGNKRLRVLKEKYGENGEVPADWFQDITAMSPAERHEFRLNANVNDGHYNLDKLLAQYGREELTDAGLEKLLTDLPPPSPVADREEWGTDFTLASGKQGELRTITFTLHVRQLEAVKGALSAVGECGETFGNTNRHGNALYEVVRQWLARR